MNFFTEQICQANKENIDILQLSIFGGHFYIFKNIKVFTIWTMLKHVPSDLVI